MLLEDKVPGHGIQNYKVYITPGHGKKKFTYTYKVLQGKSNQAIAIDILEAQGYDVGMLRRAREIIQYPERYRAAFKQ